MTENRSSEESKALIRRWFEEVWNQGRADAIPELCPDATGRGSCGSIRGDVLR